MSVLAAGVFGGAAFAQQPPRGAQRVSRRSEVEALRRFAESRHPRGREAAADADWRSRWDKLQAESDWLSDGAYLVRLRRALGWFRDGHTTVMPFEFTGVPEPLAGGPFSRGLPLHVRVFHDGAWIVATAPATAALSGARITRVGRMSDVELMRAFAEQWPGNDAWAHRWSAEAFFPAHLEALGAVDDASAEVNVEAVVGARTSRLSVKPAANHEPELRAPARTQSDVERWASSAGIADGELEAHAEARGEIAGQLVLGALGAGRAFVVGEGTVARDDAQDAEAPGLLERPGHARAGAEHQSGKCGGRQDECAPWPRPCMRPWRGFRVHCCRIAAPEGAAATASGILHGEVPKRS